MNNFMNPELCSVKKETESTAWTVLSSIGYRETELPVLSDGKMRTDMSFSLSALKEDCARYMYTGKVYDSARGEYTQMCFELISEPSPKADAEAVSAALEILLALGIENVIAKINADTRTYELLCLYGFEQYITASSSSEMRFECTADGKTLIRGGRKGNSSGGAADIDNIVSVLGKTTADTPGLSLIYAEKNAEGPGYDTAYNLRVNGCAAEFYTGSGNADEAEAYARKKGTECMLHIFANGKLIISDFIKNTKTETTVNEFLGYEEEPQPLTPQQQGFRMF